MSDFDPTARLTDAQVAQIQAALEAGRKLEAIKLYREFTGADLAAAQAAIAVLPQAPPKLAPDESAGVKTPTAALAGEIAEMLRQNAKIAAIKRYREATGVDLKDAKEAVEAIGRRLGIKDKSCFVATAVFEDAEAPAVQVLRRWRDDHLSRHLPGRLFIAGYQRIGPWLACLPRHSPRARRGLRRILGQISRWMA